MTANLNFTGKYLVLTTGKQQVGVSAKLGPQIRCRLKTLIEESGIGEYGFIVRTNAGNASDREILREMETLKGHCQKLTERAQFLSCFPFFPNHLLPGLRLSEIHARRVCPLSLQMIPNCMENERIFGASPTRGSSVALSI